MLVEKSVKEALMDYAKGRKVVVLQFDAKGRIDANLLSDFFEDENNKYLVDVPAYSDQDFEAAVQKMTCEILSADQIVAAVHETQEDSAEEESTTLLLTTPGLEEETIAPAETKEAVVLRMKKQGKTIDEIVEDTGFKKGTVKQYYTRKQGKPALKTVDNTDRHLCKTCRFRGKDYSKNGCDYIEHTGKSRRCKVENCSVYEKGDPDPIKVEEQI